MKRGRILVLLGLILALGAAAVVFVLLQRAASPAAAPEIKREKVVIAVQPIAEGELVDGRLDLKEVPSEGLTESVLRDVAEAEGQLAKIDIPQGQIVSANMIQTLEEQMRSGALSSLIEEGYLAVSFPINELTSISYGIQPGDHVDVIMTFPFININPEIQTKEPVCPPECPSTTAERAVSAIVGEQLQRLVTQLTVQDIMVLGVGRWDHETPVAEEEADTQTRGNAPVTPDLPEYITLMVQPQDALVLKLARDYQASIELAVRKLDDHTQFTNIQQVTLDYLLARFGITVPDTRDFTIEALPTDSFGP